MEKELTSMDINFIEDNIDLIKDIINYSIVDYYEYMETIKNSEPSDDEGYLVYYSESSIRKYINESLFIHYNPLPQGLYDFLDDMSSIGYTHVCLVHSRFIHSHSYSYDAEYEFELIDCNEQKKNMMVKKCFTMPMRKTLSMDYGIKENINHKIINLLSNGVEEN